MTLHNRNFSKPREKRGTSRASFFAAEKIIKMLPLAGTK
jgi:hypothetical protein